MSVIGGGGTQVEGVLLGSQIMCVPLRATLICYMISVKLCHMVSDKIVI